MYPDEWVYGDLIHKRHDRDALMIQDENGLGSDVIPESVGQFTGLHDKNGKAIHEGHVITQYLVFQNGKHYECKARGGQVVFDKLWGFVLLSESRLYHLFGDGLTQEVQGNIHDNPNLLTDDND
jgi:hypothetical protein